MKLLLVLLFTVSSPAFSIDLCRFESTTEFYEAVEAKKIKQLKVSSDPRHFSAIEKEMIYLSIVAPSMYAEVSREAALTLFSDFTEGFTEPGYNAGDITYFESDNKIFEMVHYWPGENEDGAFVEITPNGKVAIIARLFDGSITCNK
jgi:hypothetical protein